MTTTATRPADHRVTLAQIGRQTLADIGARDMVHDDPRGQLMIRYGAGTSVRKVIVTLTAGDTYTVEAGRMPTRGRDAYTWVTERTVEMVDAEALARVVRSVAK